MQVKPELLKCARIRGNMIGINDILELEREVYELRLKHDSLQARMKSRQDTLNAGIGIIVSNMNATTLSLMYSAFNEEK